MIHIESMTGIVVEIEKDTVLVLTSDGELLDVETNGKKYEVGEEIRFNKLTETKKVIAWNRVLSHTSGLAAAVLIFFTGIPLLDNGVNSGNAFAATVYVESKSNVKVSINQDQRVINTNPMDNPAKRILKDFSWKDEPINKFVDDYLHSEKDLGYLTKNDKAIIAVQTTTKTAAKTLQNIEKTISDDNDLESNDVLTVTVPAAVVQKAESIGVTPGKYAFYLAAKDQGKEIPTNVLKTSSVTELVNSDKTVAAALPTYSADKLATLANSNMAVASAPVQSDPAPKPSSNPVPKPTVSTAPAPTATPTPSTTQQAPTKPADNTKTADNTNTKQDKQDNKQDTKKDNNTNTNDIKPADTKPTDDTNNKPIDNNKPADNTKPSDKDQPKSKDPSPTPPKDGQGQNTNQPVPPPASPTGSTNTNAPTVPVVTTPTQPPAQPTTPPAPPVPPSTPDTPSTPAPPVTPAPPAPPATPGTPPPVEQPGQTAQPVLIIGICPTH